MDDGTDDTQKSLDEIDIDAILSASIGTSGQPDVPSAHEALPAPLEVDLADIEELLQEFGYLNEDGTPDLSLTETIELLRPSANEREGLENLLKKPPTAIHLELPESLSAITAETFPPEEDIFLETHLLTIPDDVELPIRHTPTVPQEPAKLLLSELLTQEADAMQIGPYPVPDHPDALPASTTRKFRTTPKRPLTLPQKRALIYAVGIVFWTLIVGHLAWKGTHRHRALLRPALHKNNIEKTNPSTAKPPPPPPSSTSAKESKTAPSDQRSASPSKDEAIPLPDDPQKNSDPDHFKPIQCNISMDSKTLREDLRKCLRSARIAN